MEILAILVLILLSLLRQWHQAKRREEYHAYLQSDDWRHGPRKKALKRANYACENCGATNTELHVHHKNYNSIFHETLSDLQVLCHKCHSYVHRH